MVFDQQAASVNPSWTVHAVTVTVTATASTMILLFSDASAVSNSLGVYIDDVRLAPTNN